MTNETLAALVSRMADRDRARSGADVQSDVRHLLLSGGLDLQEAGVLSVNLETAAGGGRRIDVEAGCAVIEVKKDLSRERAAEGAVVHPVAVTVARVTYLLAMGPKRLGESPEKTDQTRWTPWVEFPHLCVDDSPYAPSRFLI